MDLMQTMHVSMGGMRAQSARMRIVAENVANADSVMNAAGTGPYRAKQIYFQTVLNKATGAAEVRVSRVAEDTKTPLNVVYNPGHDLADARGFVQMPNVNSTFENINMREAQRSYEANMAAMDTAREMATRTLDMLR